MKLTLSTTAYGIGRTALAGRDLPKLYEPLPLQCRLDKVFHSESAPVGAMLPKPSIALVYHPHYI